AAAIIIASSSGNGLSSLVSGQLSQLPATGDKDKPQRPPELSGETFTYNDETLYAAAGVRKNEYSDAGFKYDDKGRLTYSADGKTAKLGVDVSSHQENIDWAAVKSSGVDFAMIRVGYRGNTEGKLNLDNTYHQNMRDAANAGLDVGVYFYAQAINANEAREEAEWVIDLLEGYEISYPVVYDWEYVFGDTRSANVGGETVTRCCEMFCSAIEEKGYTPMLYFYRDLAYRTL
ncbi:MAG: GH25 family lysozyme, partial [Oscillospiraceae bacterium]